VGATNKEVARATNEQRAEKENIPDDAQLVKGFAIDLSVAWNCLLHEAFVGR
jgi:hypothetical protein